MTAPQAAPADSPTPADPATPADAATAAPRIPAGRDLTLDLVRVACVLLVVVIHLLFVGVGTGPDGGIVVSRPLEQQPWFAGVTWAGQIMPLFFVVGGFAAVTGYRSHRRRGGTPAGFVRTRALRLAQPALPLFLVLAVAFGVAAAVGAPADIVGAAAQGIGSPLWFLAAYLLVQALAPAMIAWHARSRIAPLAVLAAGAVLVDVARHASGIDGIGLLNLAFVWLLVQQIGFWYADGWFDRRHPAVLLAIAAACYGLLVPLTTIGPYPVDMLVNLNPPTVPLVLLGLAQACLLRLLKPVLTALTSIRAVQGVMFLAGTRLMTIYLWHMPLILAVAGIGLLLPGAAPAPGSSAWWLSRILVFLVVMGLLFALSLLVGRFEAPRDRNPVPPTGVVVLGVALAFVPPFAVILALPPLSLLERLLGVPIAAGGSVLLAIAVLLLVGRRGRGGA